VYRINDRNVRNKITSTYGSMIQLAGQHKQTTKYLAEIFIADSCFFKVTLSGSEAKWRGE
jgi:hypothetical protein